MKIKQSLKPGEKILFSVFGAFLVLAVIGYVALEIVRSHSPNPMFVTRASFDLSPDGQAGSALFRTEGCTACHRAMRSGTNSALPLDGTGSRRSLQWIKSFLKNPEATYESKTFDHAIGKEASYVQALPEADRDKIAVFLSELRAERGSSMAKEPPPESSGFIDSMVNMFAPEQWKSEREDIRERLKREAGEEAGRHE
jgi:hypothetical protein